MDEKLMVYDGLSWFMMVYHGLSWFMEEKMSDMDDDLGVPRF